MFERFISRQPILKDNLALLGYQLSFRAEEPVADPRTASPAAFLADSATMVFHWETLTADTLAFITVGEAELLSGAALTLPRSKTVIEISSNIPPSAETVLACQDLKSAGYRLAVDGWVGQQERRPHAALADYLRVAFKKLGPGQGAAVMAAPLNSGAMLLASGVDSWEDLQNARAVGFRCYQGDFFLKPRVYRRKDISGTRRNALRLLQAIRSDPLDLAQIESVVRDEPAFTYKLLRYLNSPVMERKLEVKSIRNAVALLGDSEFRRWASLVAVMTPATDKPGALLKTGLTRAYFCEQLALRRDRARAYDYFFAGLFSVMDAVLDRPLPEIVQELAVSSEVRQALLGEPGEIFETLQAALAYERGQWSRLQHAMDHLSLPQNCAPQCLQAADRSAAMILQ